MPRCLCPLCAPDRFDWSANDEARRVGDILLLMQMEDAEDRRGRWSRIKFWRRESRGYGGVNLEA